MAKFQNVYLAKVVIWPVKELFSGNNWYCDTAKTCGTKFQGIICFQNFCGQSAFLQNMFEKLWQRYLDYTERNKTVVLCIITVVLMLGEVKNYFRTAILGKTTKFGNSTKDLFNYKAPYGKVS